MGQPQIEFTIDINACPLGFLFDRRRPDLSLESTFLPGWWDAFNSVMFPRTGPWRIITEDDGAKSLEFPTKNEGLLVTRGEAWRDYTVSLSARQFSAAANPSEDDEYQRTSRTGIAFRFQDVRRYYLFCLDALNRVVLYRRDDDQYHVLVEHAVPINPCAYYRLAVTCRDDRITCVFNDERLFDIRDNEYPAGPAALRTTTISRFRDIRAALLPDRISAFNTARDRAARDLDDLRAQQPKPVLDRVIPLPSKDTCLVWFGNLRSPDAVDMIIQPRDHANHLIWQRTIAVSNTGETLWETRAQNTSLYGTKLHAFGGSCVCDVNNDGLDELITASDGLIRIHRGRDGHILAEAPLPASGVYGGEHGKPTRYVSIYPLRLQPAPAPLGYALIEEYPSDGGNCIFALDHNLKEIWRRYLGPINYGHTIDTWDVNNDGRDEIFAGYHLLSPDGEILWRMQGYENIDIQYGARHPDTVIVGDFANDGHLKAAYAGGGDGFYLVDALTGDLLQHHRCGHCQWTFAANLCPDLPGIEIAVSTLHGNVGIVNIFDAHGNRIGRFQKSNEDTIAPLINWTGDGRHLVMLTGDYNTFGLYDHLGNRAVDNFIDRPTFDRLYGGPILKINARPWDLLNTGRDQLLLFLKGELHVYAQDKPAAASPPPTHRRKNVWPLVNYPAAPTP